MKRMVRIDFEAFVSPDGKPTCAAAWGKGYCAFLRTKCFGSKEVCGVSDNELFRDEDGNGFIRPAPGCIIWEAIAETEES